MLDPFQSLKESNVSFLHLLYSVDVLSKSVLKLQNKLQCVEVPQIREKIHPVSLMGFCLKIYDQNHSNCMPLIDKYVCGKKKQSDRSERVK